MNIPRVAIIDTVGRKAGLDHYDLSLAKALNEKSFFVKIYSNFTHQSFSEKCFPFLPEKRIGIFKLLYDFVAVLRKARSEKIETVILHLFHSAVFDYALIRLTRMFKFRICLIVHDVESLVERPGSGWIKSCIRSSAVAVVHNRATYDDLLFVAGEEIGKMVKIIPHGNYIGVVVPVDRSAALKSLSLDTGKKYILFFGMIKKSKGLGDLIHAMSLVDNEIDLIIAGRPRDVSFEEYEKMIRQLGLKKRIHTMIRYISNEERNLLFNAADALIIPYHRIYQSGVLIMGMSYRLPVIASDLSSNNLMLMENTGLLFKVGNSSDLAQKINSLFTDKRRSDSMADRGREFVAVNNSWDRIADEFANILKK